MKYIFAKKDLFASWKTKVPIYWVYFDKKPYWFENISVVFYIFLFEAWSGYKSTTCTNWQIRKNGYYCFQNSKNVWSGNIWIT